MNEGGAIILDFKTKAALKTLANEYDGRIKYVAGQARETLGLSAAVIRPDGIIAWASDNDADAASMRESIARWLIRPLSR